MELSMSMRFVRIRARQKAGSGPVLAEHTLSALLLLAGSEAQTVMPSGTEAAKAGIADEIAELRSAFESLCGIGDPLPVMTRFDELIKDSSLDDSAQREFAALQAEAEEWMEKNPDQGDLITPVAMLHAVRGKTELMLDEALMTADADLGSGTGAESSGDSSGTAGIGSIASGASASAMDTVVDAPAFDPQATVVDYVPEIGETDEASVSVADDDIRAAEEEEQRRADDAARRVAEAEAEAREKAMLEEDAKEADRRAADEAARRAADDAARREEEARDARARDEVAAQMRDALLRQAELDAQKNKGIARSIDAKAFGAFLVFAIIIFVLWQLYMRMEGLFGIEPQWWTKVIIFVVYIIVTAATVKRINSLRLKADIAAAQTTMMRIRVAGTAGMIYFRLLVLSTTFPAALLFILSLAVGEWTPFWYHFYVLYAFCWLCGLVTFAFQSNYSALSVGNLSHAQLKFKKGALVGSTISGGLTIPAFVLFLHWHFGWFPMKTWVLVLLTIYLVIILGGFVMVGKRSAYEMQNEGY